MGLRSATDWQQPREDNAPAPSPEAQKREERREAQFSPASFASTGPEPFDAGFSRLPWGQLGGCERARVKWTFARTSTEPKGSGTRAAVDSVAALG